MDLYEVYNAIQNEGSSLLQLVLKLNCTEEELIFYLDVLHSTKKIDTISPRISGIVNIYANKEKKYIKI